MCIRDSTNFNTGFDNEKLEESMKKINLKGGTKEWMIEHF